MLLECPDCHLSFRVPEGALGDAGRQVRCSGCSFEWFAEPRDLKPEGGNAEEQEEAATEEAGSEDNTDLPDLPDDEGISGEEADGEPDIDLTLPPPPAEIPPSLWPVAVGLAVLLLLSTATGMLVFRDGLRSAGLGGMYDMIGAYDTAGLQFMPMTLGKIPLGRKNRYLMEGAIKNTTDETRVIPMVRIRLTDTEGEVLRTWELTQEGEIPPGGVLPFKSDRLESHHVEKEHAFIVDLGNSLDLMFRD